MKIGFTGTQKGMTNFQVKEVDIILLYDAISYHRGNVEVHHGDCIGVDAQCHELAKKHHLTTVAHPASDTGDKRAFCKADVVLPAKPALIRNHDIVDTVDVMFAIPRESSEVLRSGTWATIRYCRKVGKIVHIIYPHSLNRWT